MDTAETPHHWRLTGDRRLSLEPWALLGILNVTPDSFSDGGRYADSDDACRWGLRMVADGAAMLDVGGESTRPGAERVAAAEQIRRVVPVCRALAAQGVAVSIDTTLAAVADAALEAGAVAINDVSGGTEDPGILEVAARRGVGLILMHRVRPPGEDRYSDRYGDVDRPRFDDVTGAVAAGLAACRRSALDAGVDPDRVVLDPGLGFGKAVEQNWRLVAELPRLRALGAPLLLGVSRKSFVGAVTGVTEPRDRVAGSVAAATAAYLRGARFFRVHDVAPTREGLAVARAIVDQAAAVAPE